MKKNESSLTSLIAAFGRAYHSQFDSPKIFDDYIAKDLFSQKEWKDIKDNMVQGIAFFNKEIAIKYKDNTDEILKWITQVQLSPTPLARSAYCEKVFLNEVKLGLKQYVILGAGLDTFCFRHPELNEYINIYEIDHPASQAFKKQKLNQAHLTIPNHLHFVTMDFTKKYSYQDLVDEGFSHQKTFFSLLGVSYYLSKEEIASLIHQLFTKVPSGSSIVFDYADDNLFKEKGISNRVQNMVQMATASGEPMQSCFTYDEVEKMLENAGLLIYKHLSPDTIHDQFFRNRTDYLSAFETIHYIHAVKK